MPIATPTAPAPRYLSLFPDWAGARPLPYFLMENLLEARRESVLPTNLLGPDEDVNVYLTGMLMRALQAGPPPEVQSFARPVLAPPARNLNRRQRADHYRLNGEHRLLMLGLFDRGDALRRHPDQDPSRDLQVGASCFAAAAALMEGRPGENRALTAIWRKLAERFAEYVQVLSVLAIQRWDLGARLSDEALDDLLPPGNPAPGESSPTVPPTADPESMDHLLDLLLELKAGHEEKRAEVLDLARRLDLDPEALLAAS